MVHHTIKTSTNIATPASRRINHMSRTSNSKSIYRGSLLASLAAVAFVLGACTTAPPVPPPVVSAPPKPVPAGPILRPASFTSLPGWQQDDLREAWPAFHSTCSAMARKPEWKEACVAAHLVDPADGPAIRQFFETYFAPWQVFNPDGSDNGLVTGYYEPLLRGARRRGGNFQIPLYRTPDDLLTVDLSSIYPELKGMRLRGRLSGKKIVPYAARADITETGMLNGSELVWVDNAVDAFFLQVQGSGRVQLADSGETVRLAYADQNGFPYKSIGRYLVDR
jgi:membrane-bound lytic murein transglycosylase A